MLLPCLCGVAQLLPLQPHRCSVMEVSIFLLLLLLLLFAGIHGILTAIIGILIAIIGITGMFAGISDLTTVAAAVLLLLLGWCRPMGPYVSFLLVPLLLPPGWCRARGPYVPFLLLLLYCDILLDKWVEKDALFVPPLFFF